MLIRRISAIAVLMFTLGTTAAATAAPSPVQAETIAQNQQQNRPAANKNGLFDKLNLSADQKQKIQAIRNQYKDQISQGMQAVRQARQELETMMSSTTATASQISTKHSQIMGLTQQLQQMQFQSTLAMREVLTGAQRTQLTQLIKERREAAKTRMQNTPKPQ